MAPTSMDYYDGIWGNPGNYISSTATLSGGSIAEVVEMQKRVEKLEWELAKRMKEQRERDWKRDARDSNFAPVNPVNGRIIYGNAVGPVMAGELLQVVPKKSEPKPFKMFAEGASKPVGKTWKYGV